MGCECAKFGTTNKVGPIRESTNHSMGVSNDVFLQQLNIRLMAITLKQPVPIISDYSRDNKEYTPVESLNSSLSDHSTENEELPLVRHTTRDLTSVFTDNLLRTVEQNTDVIIVTSSSQVKEKMNNWTEGRTTSESIFSKRIDSAASSRHSLSSPSTIDQNGSIQDETVSILSESVVDATIDALPAAANEHVEIVDADPEAFNTVFVKQRQDTIDNSSYRSTIQSWRPNSLVQLSGSIQNFSQEKSAIECHWMIFYWIACNIEYDAVSYFNDDISGQSAEEVFHTKKGVCAGYSRLYQYLCDQLGVKCQAISGYAKGYGFDKRDEIAPWKKDHAWNAVQISDHWYLVDSTWGAGHLTKEKVFKRELNFFYFLAPPHQMIYHHLPEDDQWQLLRTPVNITQYIQMPQIRSPYFDLKLELVSPLHQSHLSLVRDKSYALVLIRAPVDVDLLGNLRLNDNDIEGGHRIIFDVERHLYRCYFAPVSIGRYIVELFAKKINSASESYENVLDFTLNITEVPSHPVSYPKTWKLFYDLGLKMRSPVNTHLIKVCNGVTHARVIIQAPTDVVLNGTLTNNDGTKVEGGEQVYYDRQKSLWKCKFAPDRDGIFEANIFGKKQSDPGSYSSVISFKIDASQISSPPLSYPHTWQLFHDLNLKVVAPQNCSTVPWPEHASYVEVLIRVPNDVQLSCDIRYKDVVIENGSLAQFDAKKMLWQLLFAPQCIGEHDLFIFAKRNDEEEAGSALQFHLNVTQLHQSTKFPLLYGKFHTRKCRIYGPLDGALKEGATVPIHCVIPGASEVNVKVDSNWLKADGYQDPILKRKITVGSQAVTVLAKYGQQLSYEGLVQYSVQKV